MLLKLRLLPAIFLIGFCASAQSPSTQPTVIEMSNVLFRCSPSLTILIVRLRGKLIPTPGHDVPSFNDPSSFVIGADAAEIHMSTDQLDALMNSWLLRSPAAQLKSMRIAVEGNHLLIHGTLKKGLHIPFTATALPSLTNDNRIRFTVQQTSSAHIPMKGLMDSLGISLQDLISQKGMQGLSIDKDSMLIDPQTAFPPPQIRAKITGVRLAGQTLVLTFGQGAPTLSPQPAKNFVSMHGGNVKFGHEEMFNADIVMIDTTPADPFDFYLGDYWCQIVHGSIKATPEKGYRIYLTDFSKLSRNTCR